MYNHNLRKHATVFLAAVMCLTNSLTKIQAEDNSDGGRLTLNYDNIEAATSETIQLTVSDSAAVSWFSSDEAVATVDDDGTVYVHRYGNAVITAMDDSDPSLTASCRIHARFNDVNDSSKYYFKPVYWAADKGITTGYDKVYFGPQRNCTRRELSIFLWRLAGRPAAEGTLPFSDTKSYKTSTDTYKAILWCYTNGIVKGYSNGTFKPNDSIVRKDTMIMLYRLAGRPEVSGTMKFRDVAALNYPATSDTYRSVIWGTENEITKGYQNGTFQPLANCLREHIVTFIYRYDKVMNPEAVLINDTDQDGLPDYDEESLGTDPENPDTDGDGYSDYAEFLMGTDPLVDEAVDPDLDSDEDEIPDAVEASTFETDPYSADTDGDGLTDYDEVYVYFTNPLNPDTDNDGLSDGFEVENGLDPKAAKTDGTTPDNEQIIEQELDVSAISIELLKDDNTCIPSIHGETSGELSKNVFISTPADTSFTDARAVVGSPVMVNGDDDYLNGLTLDFDLSSYAGDQTNLWIVKVDDEGNLVPADCTVGDNTLSADLTGAGVYFVVDLKTLLLNLGIRVEDSAETAEAIEKIEKQIAVPSAGIEASKDNGNQSAAEPVAAEINEEQLAVLNELNSDLMSSTVSGQADIVFAIDTTGSMSGTINNVITNVTSFATTLSTTYNVNVNYALIDYKDLEEDGAGTTIVVKNGSSNWYTDVNSFTTQLKTLRATGGGDAPECSVDALETARRLDFRPGASKFVILITDVDYKVRNDYGIASMEEEADLLARDGIITSVVTGSSYKSTYQYVYETTGGIYADINSSAFSASLLSLADMIGEQTSDGTWVILKPGYRYVKLIDDLDQDGDGIPTDKELGSPVEVDLTPLIDLYLLKNGVPLEHFVGKKIITMYKALSDPTLYDTDDDGISDAEDEEPWVKGGEDGICGKLYLITCYGESFSSGHSFFSYESYIKDSIDFSGLVNGWQRIDKTGSWIITNIKRDTTPTDSYAISRGEFVNIGNGALGSGFSGGSSDGSSDGSSAGDANGVNYNMETAKFASVGRPVTPYQDFTYLPNTYITEEITSATLEKLISYLSQDSVNYWSLHHNCAEVAADGWNYISDETVSAYGLDGWHIYPTPSALRDSLRKIDGHAEDWQMSQAFR